MKPLQHIAVLTLLLLSCCHAQQRWTGSWSASQQIPTGANALPANELQNATLRQVVHLSLGGEQLRVRMANTFGAAPLHLASVTIEAATLPLSRGGVDTRTARTLTFHGSRDVTIPAGAEYVSDPVAFHAAPLSNLTITITYTSAPEVQTSHPGSRATSFLWHGPGAARPTTFTHWFNLSGVDVLTSSQAATIVTLGDSITDGHGATDDGNDRWPDDLAARLQATPALRTLGVLNQGLGGNRVLLDGQGPNALARFDRDVLAQPGVRYVIVFEGVNDLGMSTKDAPISSAEHTALVANILGAYQQMIDRAHTAGLKIYGATITPYTGFTFYHPTAANEADRQAINAWIRTPGHFDAALDFDAIVADPANRSQLLPKFDSGDHIHPNALAYHVIADSIPLSLFAQ